MDRCMDQNNIGPLGAEPVGRWLTAMRGTIVSDQEHATRRTIRLPAHDLNDEALESCDAVLELAAAKKLGSLHVPRSEIRQRVGSDVFVLNIDRAPRGRWQRTMFAPSCLDAGLLVDAEYVIARPQRCTFPPTLVKIDDTAGFAGCGSRGNIQLRWRHGRNASWPSQRQSVVPLIFATRPLATASCRNSATDHRARGRPRRDGSSEASALIATTTPAEPAESLRHSDAEIVGPVQGSDQSPDQKAGASATG